MKSKVRSAVVAVISAIVLFVACGDRKASADEMSGAVDNSNSSEILIGVSQNDLRVTYGKYSETEVVLTSALGQIEEVIEWTVPDASLPAGIQMEQTNKAQVLLFGTPQFTGEWCFLLSARLTVSAKQVFKELCFLGDENADMQYPRFLTDRTLPQAILDQFYQTKLQLDSTLPDTLKVELVDGALPSDFEWTAGETGLEYILQGRAKDKGSYVFTMQATDETNATSFRQFRLIVDNEQTPACPPGYYYDVNLGYCVAINQVVCPPGTYYDAATNSCIPYEPPPVTVTCPPGSVFDPYLSSCVPIQAPRCPWGYHWDDFYNRCVADAKACPPGYAWNYVTNRCEWVWPVQCPPGTWYDPHTNRCIRITTVVRRDSTGMQWLTSVCLITAHVALGHTGIRFQKVVFPITGNAPRATITIPRLGNV